MILVVGEKGRLAVVSLVLRISYLLGEETKKTYDSLVTFVVYDDEGLVSSGEGDRVAPVVPPVEHRRAQSDVVEANHVVHLTPPVLAHKTRVHEALHVPRLTVVRGRRTHPVIDVRTSLCVNAGCCFNISYGAQQKGDPGWQQQKS